MAHISSFHEFVEEIKKELLSRFNEGEVDILIENVEKPGVTLTGLVLKGKVNVSPTLYCEPAFEAYNDGVPLAEIVNALYKAASAAMMSSDFDLGAYQDWEKIKNNIFPALCKREGNEKFLSGVANMPFREDLDLALYFRVEVELPVPENSDSGVLAPRGSFAVTPSHLKEWGKTLEQVRRAAKKATKSRSIWLLDVTGFVPFPEDGFVCLGKTQEGYEIYAKNLVGELSALKTPYRSPDGEPVSLYALRVAPEDIGSKYGAGVIEHLPEGFLKSLADNAGVETIILIPSSKEEWLLRPDWEGQPLMWLSLFSGMVGEVNSERVAPGDILSDHLYIYVKAEDKILTDADFLEKFAEAA